MIRVNLMAASNSALIVVAVLLLPSSAIAQTAEDACPPELAHIRTIVIDPGHGGSNEGAVGVAGIYERFLTMDTAKLLQTRLSACFPDVIILLTRQNDTDVSLTERTHFANVHQADMFISLHYNAAVNGNAQGIEVFYLSAEEESPEPWAPDTTLVAPQGTVVESILQDLDRTHLHRTSADLADHLQRALVNHTGASDRGVRQGRFRVIRGAHMPAIVIEFGFLTHPREGLRLADSSYTETLVDAMIDGIGSFAASTGDI